MNPLEFTAVGYGVLAAIFVFVIAALGLFNSYREELELLKRQRQDVADAKTRLERDTEIECRDIILKAKDEALGIRAQAQEEAILIRGAGEQELRERRTEVQRLEAKQSQREQQIAYEAELLANREAELLGRLTEREQQIRIKDQNLEGERLQLTTLQKDLRSRLQTLSHLSEHDARSLLLQEIEAEARHNASNLVRQIENEAKVEGDRRARNIVVSTIQRIAVNRVAETTVSVVSLPSDDIKGRIIGREGRNVRAFETLTGVDVIIDDTPEAVVLSAFDPVRREVARRALTNLILDGRIHPTRIEEMVTKAQEEVEASILEAGEEAALETKVSGLHPELIRLIGRMRYRFSYGQNLLAHSIEVSHIGVLLASELGANVGIVRRACLMHDLGKIVPDAEGPHALVSRDIMLRYGETETAAHAAGAHHNEMEHETIEDVLVQLADSISASRPGARREALETYIKRLEKLERIAESFPGVEKTYAVQAGRELRLIVQPDVVDDNAARQLVSEIARRIEGEVDFPGQIKITAIRETRAIDYAK